MAVKIYENEITNEKKLRWIAKLSPKHRQTQAEKRRKAELSNNLSAVKAKVYYARRHTLPT